MRKTILYHVDISRRNFYPIKTEQVSVLYNVAQRFSQVPETFIGRFIFARKRDFIVRGMLQYSEINCPVIGFELSFSR